jgi:hypothetical protein
MAFANNRVGKSLSETSHNPTSVGDGIGKHWRLEIGDWRLVIGDGRWEVGGGRWRLVRRLVLQVQELEIADES